MPSTVLVTWGKIVAFMWFLCSLYMDRICHPVYRILPFAHQPVNNYDFSPITPPLYVPAYPHQFSKNQSVILRFFTVSTMTTISTTNLNLFER